MVGQLLLSSSSRVRLCTRVLFPGNAITHHLTRSKAPVTVNNSLVWKRNKSSSRDNAIQVSPAAEVENLLDTSELLPDPVVVPPPPATPTLWTRIKAQTGLSTLIPEWKLMFSRKDLMNDLSAGITVGCVAMPLALAIGLASGVSPEVGLVSAIVGGTVASIFGGAPLGITGPSLATSVLLASVASAHGVSGLIFVTCVTGGLQVLSGVLRLGGLVRYVPQPVISGFTAGVGGVMLFGQLPRVLGITGPSAPGIAEMMSHVATQVTNINPASVMLSLGVLATTMLLPRVLPKVPASVVAVVGAASLNAFLGLGAPVIGALPTTFPMPSLPAIPDLDTMYSLVGSSLALYGLTSLESLLSGSAADKIDKEDPRKHNPNVDLVGQGLSNMAVSCFGGIPVTGAIARTSLNINAGAKTRRASIFHVGVLGAVFAMGPVISMIPLSALSGILLSVAIRLLNPKELKFLSKVSYREVLPLAATFGTVLMSDLVTGVQVGTATAVGMQLLKHTPRLLTYTQDESSNTFWLHGDVTFMSAARIGSLQKELTKMPVNAAQPVVLDCSAVRSMDATACEMLVDIVYDMEELGHTPKTFKLVRMSRELHRVMLLCDSRGLIEKFICKKQMRS